MTKKPPPFESETALCARFISGLKAGWTPYAETAGWDILLVRDVDGFQIGIEAKLKLNAHVISQCLEEYGHWSADRDGPDCRAVLVPTGESGYFGRIAHYIGVTIIMVRTPEENRYTREIFQPDLPRSGQEWDSRNWHQWAPTRRHKLPEYVPDVAAGASAPMQLTDWKISALKIIATIEKRGYVTRADFKHHKMDHRRWLTRGAEWLVAQDGRFTPGPYLPNLKEQHPTIYVQILADAEKWMPKEPALVS